MQPSRRPTISVAEIMSCQRLLTEEDGEKDKRHDVENLEVLEFLVQPADDRRSQEDGKESDRQPGRQDTLAICRSGPKVHEHGSNPSQISLERHSNQCREIRGDALGTDQQWP